MDWNDSAARCRLIDRVGPDEYERQFAAHRAASVLETVNGHELRAVDSRFGRLITVGNTGRAFATMEEARAFAKVTP